MGAVMVMVPVALLQTGWMVVTLGTAGIVVGAVITALLAALKHPLMLCVTVNVAAVLTVLGLPVPASLQLRVPVIPLTVRIEIPQLLITDKTGADGIALGAVVTALLEGLVQPLIDCVTV